MCPHDRPTLPDAARIETGDGGLERLVIATAEAEAHVYRHGAHLTHFQPVGERPVLWMSGESRFQAGAPGQPIRGGVPICFPWFGPAPSGGGPPHGFARLLSWRLLEVVPERDALRASYGLGADDYTRGLWGHDFEIVFSVSVGRRLEMALVLRNTGDRPFTFEEALHTYLAVSDVRQAIVRGLERVPYLDKVGGATPRPGADEPITVSAETDRVYRGTSATVTIVDGGWGRSIAVRKTGSATTVVWNPWVAKSKAMPDFGDEEWPGMLCVETANAAEDAVTLEPGASHTLSATIEVTPG